MHKLSQHVLSLVLMISGSLLLLGWSPAIASAAPVIPHPNKLARAVQEVEALDAMRTRLASSLEGSTEAPTMQTMKEVCRPVGMRAIQLSQENGWQVKQIAKKYRNPDHAPGNFARPNCVGKIQPRARADWFLGSRDPG
jgi:hypothetical protein